MQKLKHPATLAALLTFVCVALGVALSWRALSAAAEQAAAVRLKSTQPELKQKGWDFWTIEIENLANELKEERARLAKVADALEQRSARLAAEEKEFGKRRAEIDGLRKKIAERVVEIQTEEAKNLRTLAATYTNLSPRAAVAILRQMDDGAVVKILSFMKADTVGPIFEEMTKAGGEELSRRAAALSDKLRLVNAAKTRGAS